jgi:hypothetical protein
VFRSRTCLPIVLAALVAPAAALAQPRRPAPTPTPAPPPPSLTEDQARTIAEAAADAAVARERARAEAEATERDAKAAAELAAARAEVTALREKIDALAVEQGAIKAAADASAAEAKAADGDDYVKGGGGFTDVRLNLTFTNENMLTKPGETIPSVPGWRFGRPNSLGTLFFDNYDTRFSGYETLGHAIIYRNYRKGHVEAEGGLVIRMNELAERRIDLSDAGSYVLVSWWKDPERKDPTRFTLTAFPVSSDRMRLGYSYRLSWGGNEEYRRSSQAVPGVKLQVDTEKAYAFVGAKSSVLLDKRDRRAGRQAGLLVRRRLRRVADAARRGQRRLLQPRLERARGRQHRGRPALRRVGPGRRPRRHAGVVVDRLQALQVRSRAHRSGVLEDQVPGRRHLAGDGRGHLPGPDPQGPREVGLDQGPVGLRR